MKILHLTPYYAPAYPFGGVVRAVEGLARAQAKRGHEVTVLTTDALARGERYHGRSDETRDGVRVIRAPNLSLSLRARGNLSTPIAMRHLAPALVRAAEIIHAHEFRTAENLIVTPIAARLGKRLALSPHGTLSRESGQSGLKLLWDRLFAPVIARRFAVVIGLTPAETDEARALFAAFGVAHDILFCTVPNGVNADEFADLGGGAAFRARWQLGDAPILLYLGRLHRRKGLRELVAGFKAAGVPGARLVIAGPDEGEQAAIAPEIDESILLTGYLDDAARKDALAAADAFVLPALAGEGLPVAVLEAMAAGLPVIVSPACNVPQVATAGAGMIAEVGEPLTQAIRQLLTDPALRRRMGENARRLARDQFTWDAAAAALEGIYQGSRL